MLMALNIAEAAGIAQMEPGSAPYLHTVAESIKLAFDDRNAYFGDPDFATVPMKGLLSKDYAAQRAKQIGPKDSLETSYGDPWELEGRARTTTALTPDRQSVVSDQSVTMRGRLGSPRI